MSIESKAELLSSLERDLSTLITAADMARVLTVVSDQLADYDLQRHAGSAPEADDLLATNLIRHGMPIQEVAAILGHDKLDTTMQYVVLDKTDIKHAYQRFA